ncbi:MAG: fibro-slime domain-containing protein [Planctomycetota bacterium]|jgi:fibro-slime domain-containing protein
MRHRPTIVSTASLLVVVAVPHATAEDLPERFTLTGVVRDFKERSVEGGHLDFEKAPDNDFGLYCGNIAHDLDADGKPVFVGGGRKVRGHAWAYEGGSWFTIAPHMFDPSIDQYAADFGPYDSGGVTSAASFSQWFRDVPGLNLSQTLSIDLVRQADGLYVFDSATVEPYASIGGFFPIDDELYGNSPGTPHHNYHFTVEIAAEFIYDENAGQVFTFTGDDDVYVFINGRLVIDLGGVHGVTSQSVLVDRLGLEDGQAYHFKFFFAERHRTQSNFRVTTNMLLEGSDGQTITAAYD